MPNGSHTNVIATSTTIRADRRREARALTIDELRRLLDVARTRPLSDALTIRSGKRKGERAAKVNPERRAELERLGAHQADAPNGCTKRSASGSI